MVIYTFRYSIWPILLYNSVKNDFDIGDFLFPGNIENASRETINFSSLLINVTKTRFLPAGKILGFYYYNCYDKRVNLVLNSVCLSSYHAARPGQARQTGSKSGQYFANFQLTD